MKKPGTDPTRSGSCNVWIVNHYADAPDRPAGTRHFDLGRQLVTRGRSVTIFAAGFSHATRTEVRLRGWQLYRVEWFEGVRFVWLRTFPYRANNWRRQVNMLSYVAAFLVVQTRFVAPDTIIGSTVHPFAAFSAWLGARLRRARFIFEVRDLWPQTLVDLGDMRVGSPGERLLRWIETFLVRHARVVITLLPGIQDYLLGRGLPANHVVYIPNGVDLEAFDAAGSDVSGKSEGVQRSLAIVERLRAEGRFVVGYVGSLGHVNHAEVIVRAAALAELQAPGRIGVILVGDGPERVTLERLTRAGGPVEVGPAVPRRDVPILLRALDATVVHATATPVYRYGISFNKLFYYMAAEQPVVFACSSAYDPVSSARAGVSVQPDDAQSLADAFVRMAAMEPGARKQMGQAGRRYVSREHDIRVLGEALAAIIPCIPLAH